MDAVEFDVTTEPVVGLSPVAGVHVYEVAPLAVKVADAPEQMVAELTEIVGVGFTVSPAVLVAEQPEVVPVTVYVWLLVALLVTVDPVVALNPVEGVQL